MAIDGRSMMATKPEGVKQAELVLWISITIFTFIQIIDKLNGTISFGILLFSLIFNGLYCIVPHKIGLGLNQARYIYIAILIVKIVLLFSGRVLIPKLDGVMTVLMLPLDGFITYRLFQREANDWFSNPIQK